MTFPSLSARCIKATVVLESAEILAASQQIQNAAGKVPLRISIGGRTVQAEVNAKSLRKALSVLSEAGANGAVVILQGRLDGEVLLDAGITAQAKQPKQPAAEAA